MIFALSKCIKEKSCSTVCCTRLSSPQNHLASEERRRSWSRKASVAGFPHLSHSAFANVRKHLVRSKVYAGFDHGHFAGPVYIAAFSDRNIRNYGSSYPE